MTGSVKAKHASSDSSMYGLLLMLGYLGFDGFTSTFQDKLFKASALASVTRGGKREMGRRGWMPAEFANGQCLMLGRQSSGFPG